MPHISVKMIEGRSEGLKQTLAQELQNTLIRVLGCSDQWVSVSVEDFTAQEWQDVFAQEIADNENIKIPANYDPKSLL